MVNDPAIHEEGELYRMVANPALKDEAAGFDGADVSRGLHDTMTHSIVVQPCYPIVSAEVDLLHDG